MRRRIHAIALALFAAPLALATARPGELPRLTLTRVFSRGGSESLSLRCERPDAGTDAVCDIIRFRNGYDVSRTSLARPRVEAILASFFESLPAGALRRDPKPAKAVEAEARAADPSFIWDVALGERTAQGYVERAGRATRDPAMMRALLSLEGELEAQFYR